MSRNDNDITLAVIQHMQGMEQRLTKRIDTLEEKVDGNHAIAMRNHAQTMASLDTIDARLDDLEVVQVPNLKKAVGMK